MDENGYSGRLRKRKKASDYGSEESLSSLLQLSESCGKMVIFSGSGLSANSGMSMFTTKNGLYERARSKFKIQDGMKLFSYPFYKQRRKDLQAFFAQIYSEAQSSRAAPGHVAIAELHKMGRLQRHYTLNIDGLAAAVGMDTWHHEHNPEGSTVEMHGNISYVVCPSCHAVEPLTGLVMETMKACEAVLCKACNEDEMRFKVMLYDDEQGDCITPEDVFERLDDDLAVAGAVVWVGISFEQSASTEYFRKVRHMLACHGRLHEVTQVIVNPSEEPFFNVISTMSNKEDVKVLDVRSTSDDALPRLVQHLHQLGGTSPDSAAMQAAAEAAKAAAAASHKRKLEQQQLADAAAGLEERATPRSCGGGRRRRASSATSPEGHCALTAQADTAGSRSYAELAAMDSAAAAALSLPAAVQKHFAQRQIQLQLAGVAANGVKTEAAAAASCAPQQQQVHSSPPPPPAAAADLPQQMHAATAAPAAAPGGGQAVSTPALSAAQQQAVLPGNLLGQLQVVQALLAASQRQQQQQPSAMVSQPLAGSPLLAAGLQAPALSAGSSSSAHLGVNPLLAAVLANTQAAAAAAATTAAARQQPSAAVNGNPLAAAAALLASSPAVASLLLANPALRAAAAAAAGNGACNGASPGAPATQAPAAQAPAPAPAAAATGPDLPTGSAGQPVGGPAEEDQDAMQHSSDQAAAGTTTAAAAAAAGTDAGEAGGAAGVDVKREPEPGDGPAGVGRDAAGDSDACNGME